MVGDVLAWKVGRRAVMAALAIGIVGAATLPAHAAEGQALTGLQIVEEMERRHDRPYEVEHQVMILVGPDKQQERRLLRRYKREMDDGSRSVMVFHEPAGVRGTSLLTWQFDDRSDDQWLYLPAMGTQLRRIAEGGKSNYFMGTDYTYEDMTSEPNEKFSFEVVGEEVVNGAETWIIKRVATDARVARESGYAHTMLYVRKDIYFNVRTDYFDKRGNFIKRQEYDKLQQIDGDAWRANVSFMKNTAENHVTAVQVTGRSFDQTLVPEDLFTSRYVTSGRLLR